jgi:MioC protein
MSSELQVTILVGSMTGTADLVASEVKDRLATRSLEVTILPMDRMSPAVFQRSGVFLLCTSTYGNGDVPDNAKAFYSALQKEKPALSGVRYGLIALGDRTYKDTFCQGGKRFDELLLALGAERVGDPLFHDASSGSLPEEVAADWSEEWSEECFPAA